MTEVSTGQDLHKTGEPMFRVERKADVYEIREYEPYLVAEVTVPGPADAASSAGFQLLAGYIFGGNTGSTKLAMTAPVTQAPVMLDMTAPVTQEQRADRFVVHFVMPPGYTIDTLPTPNNGRVTLREVPAQRLAVLRYSGRWTEENYAEHLGELRAALHRDGIVPHGEPILSRYNGPYVLPFLRRNEIWLAVP